MVNHEIYDDAGDGNVEPQRQGPARDDAVLVETLQPGATQRDDDHGNDNDGENGVRGKQSEINGADPTLALEVNYLTDAYVVDDIGNQERAGDEEGGDHELLVKRNLPGTDGRIAGGEQNGASAVESGVECGVGEHRQFAVVSYEF